jgi:hypothetical protein
MSKIIPLALALALVGCTPTGTSPTPGGSASPKASSSAGPSAQPSAAASAPAGLPTTRSYTEGTLSVEGVAVALPTSLSVVKQVSGDAVARLYGIGIPADAKQNDWFLIINYGIQGAARNLQVQLVQKTGERAQDIQTFGFALVDAGKGAPIFVPTGATGTATEHDGKLDISFSGKLLGVPSATKQIDVKLPNLPLE